MSEQRKTTLPFAADDATEKRLWDALGEIPAAEPSANLRRNFYARLEQEARPTFPARLRQLLGFGSNAGWITATACLLIGLVTGQVLETGSGNTERLAALEQNVTMLNRTLVLDRLENDSAGKRLQGVLDAAYLASDDTEIANALLQRATEERVNSVRAAAIDVLGRQLGSPAIGRHIMDSIIDADSPIVQLALIDLVLRNGDAQQLNELLQLAEDGALYPDLARHVLTSLKRDTA